MDRTIYRSCSCCNCDFFVYGYHQSKDHCLKHNCHVNRNYDCCPNFQRLRVKIGDKIKFKYMNDIIEQTVINIHYISDCELYEVAFSHSSYANEHRAKKDYERLEFLGDSILDFLVGDFLFKNSDKDEGFLTVMRSHFVSEAYLCTVFDKLDLDAEIIKGKSMGSNLPKAVKADIVEAIIAAIYLDSSLDEAKRFIERNFDLKNFNQVKNTN